MPTFAIMTPSKDVIFDAETAHEAAMKFQEEYGYYPYTNMVMRVYP